MMRPTTNINIYGKAYPCRVVMGAFVRFKRESGRDVSQMSSSDIGDMMLLFWCCVKSTCNADKVPFNMDFETFADGVEQEQLDAFSALLTGDGVEKKTAT